MAKSPWCWLFLADHEQRHTLLIKFICQIRQCSYDLWIEVFQIYYTHESLMGAQKDNHEAKRSSAFLFVLWPLRNNWKSTISSKINSVGR